MAPFHPAAAATHRTDWFRDAGWGVFCHYLADAASATEAPDLTVEAWNARVDRFDAEGLARQLAEVRAGYLVLTLGQNSGFYLSPNSTYDRLAGVFPGKLSQRDLVADLWEALAPRGIRLMTYLPAGAPRQDRAAVARLEWTDGPHRNREFQRKWEAVIREWSERWRERVSGWWFDGCYWPEVMYPQDEAPNFATFAAAARAGNPESILAFNPGVKYPIIALTDQEDYTAGEVNDPARVEPPGRWLEGRQFHMLSYLGEAWGRGAPRFSDAQVAEWTRAIMAREGVVSWDVPIREDGLLPQEFLVQLAAIRR